MALSTAEAINFLRNYYSSDSAKKRREKGIKTDYKKLGKALQKVHSKFKIDARKPISSGKKSAITKLSKEFFQMGQKGVPFYRPTKKRKSDISTVSDTRVSWDYFPMPLQEGDKVRYRKGNVLIVKEFETRVFIPFDARNLLMNLDAEIVRVLGEIDSIISPDAYFLGIGRYFYKGGRESEREFSTPTIIAKQIQSLMKEYGNAHLWLNGIYGMKWRNQDDKPLKQIRAKGRAQRRKQY